MSSGIALAQVDKNSDLFKTLAAKDSILFKVGFNKYKVEKSAELMFDDLEFYHDKGGISNSKEEFVKTMKNRLCRENNPEKVYRFLVEESLEVFPMYDNGKLYGALQNGKHFFSPNEFMNFEKTDNYALFSHLWIIEDDEWKLKRVISYNHISKAVENTVETVTVSKDTLESYTGTYSAKTVKVTISIKEDNLLLTSGEMITELKALTETLFAHPQAPLTFEFVRNDEENVNKILVRENDKIVEEVKKQ
ncbi:hypothetical protein WPG_0110 [Winogradskyella sp. PG-2]|nr:hypothetical protein WPG_0110 [Winogradskyella sp. PG-2]